jgi:CRISPR-associated protein Cmr5
MTNDSSSLPLDLERAKHALAQVEAIRDLEYGNYSSYVKALPAAILQNGLGQSLATLLAAAKVDTADPHKLLYDHLAAWLTRDQADAPYRGETDLLKAIMDHDEDSYLLCQAEALAYLRWLKKFATAFLDSKEHADGAPALP